MSRLRPFSARQCVWNGITRWPRRPMLKSKFRIRSLRLLDFFEEEQLERHPVAVEHVGAGAQAVDRVDDEVELVKEGAWRAEEIGRDRRDPSAR